MSFENPLWGASIGERDSSAMRNLGAVSDGAIEWSGGPDAESRGEYGLKAILLEMASNSVINEPESSLGAARYCLRHLVPFDHSMAPS
jgi:hypothetical protein